MEIKSLARKTDLIFSKFSGEVVDRSQYLIVRTPSNPGFHWGNFIIFDRAPKIGDLRRWKSIFEKEFEYYKNPHHYVFTWDTATPELGEIQEFLDFGFELETAVVLKCNQLNRPPHFNPNVTLVRIETDQHWEDVVKLQVLCADPKYANDGYENFKRRQMDEYRRMSTKGLGDRFGIYCESKLVADLGIYFEDKIGRYQNVCTHPDYRKRGICGTLVYLAGLEAQKRFDVSTLVMEADANYHAARIYESVGFERCETNYSLSWF